MFIKQLLIILVLALLSVEAKRIVIHRKIVVRKKPVHHTVVHHKAPAHVHVVTKPVHKTVIVHHQPVVHQPVVHTVVHHTQVRRPIAHPTVHRHITVVTRPRVHHVVHVKVHHHTAKPVVEFGIPETTIVNPGNFVGEYETRCNTHYNCYECTVNKCSWNQRAGGHSCDPTGVSFNIDNFVDHALKCEDTLDLCEESSLHPSRGPLTEQYGEYTINENNINFSLGYRQSRPSAVIPENYICAYEVAQTQDQFNYGMKIAGSNENVYLVFRDNKHQTKFFYDNHAIAKDNNVNHTLLLPPNSQFKIVFVNHVRRTAFEAKHFQIDFNYMTDSEYSKAVIDQFGSIFGKKAVKAVAEGLGAILMIVVCILCCCCIICIFACKGALSCCFGGRSDDDYVEIQEEVVYVN